MCDGTAQSHRVPEREGDDEMSEQTRSALAGVDLFRDLPEETLDELAEQGNTNTYEPEEQLTEQGDTDAGLHVILDGMAELVVNGVARATLCAGDYFGAVSVIDRAPRAATIVASSEGLTTFSLSPSALAPMLQREDVAVSVIMALCGRIRDLESFEVSWPVAAIHVSAHGHS